MALGLLRQHTPTLLRHGLRASRTASAAGPAILTAPARWTSSSSVNADEISHFNALASTWWDAHGSSRILHLMNPLRHDFIRSCRSSSPVSSTSAPSSAPKLRYLDIGCGGGIFAESAARLLDTSTVTAVDPSPLILAVAKQHAQKDPTLMSRVPIPPNPSDPNQDPQTQQKLTYLNASIETLPTPTSPAEQFDIVSLFEVIEHVDQPAAFLDRCGAFVKPGGWLVMSTIARTWTSWLTTNLVAEDLLSVVPKGTHDWHKYINEDELRGHFRGKSEWGAPRVVGVVYVPGLGWKEVGGSEKIGNYFFGIQRIA